MGRTIIKIRDRYYEWSSVVDAPITHGMDEAQLKNYIREEYGNRGLEILPERLERVAKTGTSSQYGTTLEQTIACNRAGENGKQLTLEEIYERYTADP